MSSKIKRRNAKQKESASGNAQRPVAAQSEPAWPSQPEQVQQKVSGPQDNYWSYALMLLMKAQLRQIMDSDFVGKLLPLIHMTPEDPRRRLRPEDVDSAFSEETIRDFDTRYADIVPLGPNNTNITLSNMMTRCMELFLKLHLKGVKSAKPMSISAFGAFLARGQRYKCNETGLLFYMDKEVIVGKITRVLSVDVLTFEDDFQQEEDGEHHTFHFMLLKPLRDGQFEAEEIYPLGWYASIIRPVDFDENDGVWCTYAYDIKCDLDNDVLSDSE